MDRFEPNLEPSNTSSKFETDAAFLDESKVSFVSENAPTLSHDEGLKNINIINIVRQTVDDKNTTQIGSSLLKLYEKLE